MTISLGYLGITSPNVDAWPDFAERLLGLMPVAVESGSSVKYRVDDASWRLQIHPGPSNDVAYIGWDAQTEAKLEEYRRSVEKAGAQVHVADEADRLDRDVQKLYWFLDPAGFRHELSYGKLEIADSFFPTRKMSGFVTGSQGLGHVVLGVPDLEASHDFFTEALGFRLSDRVLMPGGREGRFYHCNGRHHTLALAPMPGRRSLHHLMIEVGSINDVGVAYDICRDMEVPVLKELGRHTNDNMISFYLRTPSEFLIEYGWGGLEVGPEWPEKTFSAPSLWGHRAPEGSGVPTGLIIEL